jgi:hypothetical protein
MMRNVFLASACCIGFAVGSATSAPAATLGDLGLSYSSNTQTLISTVSSSTAFWSTLYSALGATNSTITASAYSGLFSYITNIYNAANAGYDASGDNFVYSSVSRTVKGQTSYAWTDILTLTSATTNSFATVSFAGNTVTAVPGPIAGAGLPIILGMMGYGAWRRRRAASLAA